jgi:hypothetical protein
MERLIERVARLLCRQDAFRNNGAIGSRAQLDNHVDHLWPTFRGEALGAILVMLTAIREPSETMQLAGHNQRNDPATGLSTNCGTDQIYTSMIDALIREIEGTPR